MKLYICCLGYEKPGRVIRAVERFFRETLTAGLHLEFKVIDAHYPIPSKEENSLELANFVIKCALDGRFDSCVSLMRLDRNFGQDGNFNRIHEFLKPAPNDAVIWYCPDEAPRDPRWLIDMVKVLEHSETGFVTMNVKCTDDSLSHQGEKRIINGIPVRVVCWPGGFGLSGFKGKLIQTGPFNQTHSSYGGTEGNLIQYFRAAGLQGYMLEEHDDQRALDGIDGAYQEWKAWVIQIPGRQKDFEEWARERGLIK